MNWRPQMDRALALAALGAGTTSPNPMVGALVLDRDGQLVGEGYHCRAGEPHAEVMALAQASGRARGGTLVVTLEPCCHHGKTPPCTEAVVAAGIAREQARKDLPLSTYTEAYWKIDLHNLLHFLALRMDPHAQLEIRRYAETIGHQIVAPLFPLVWEAFLDYRMESVRLTRLDREVIRRLAAAGHVPAPQAAFLAAQDPSWQGLDRCRERDECLAKLRDLGLVAPQENAP